MDRAVAALNMYIIDDETPTELKVVFQKHVIGFQLIPPHNHRRSSPERAIWTFKNHFLVIVAGEDPDSGKRLQLAPKIDDLLSLDLQCVRLVQSIVGSSLYYARAIDSTLLPALNDIGAS